MKKVLIVLMMIVLLMPLAAQEMVQGTMGDDDKVQMEAAVRVIYAGHTAMRLQDFYKSFYQDRFGPEHLISDSASVRRYLLQELQTADTGGLLFEPVGMHHNYIRVYLRAVQDSLIDAYELVEAFIGSASQARKRHYACSWQEEWRQLVATIDRLQLPLSDLDADKLRIAQMLQDEGDVAVTHSTSYREAYHPHYRIVCEERFMRDFLPRFQKDKVVVIAIDVDVDKELLQRIIARLNVSVLNDVKDDNTMVLRVPDSLSVRYVLEQLRQVAGVR